MVALIVSGAFDVAWEERHSAHPWGEFPDPRALDFIKHTFGEDTSTRILDLGCGTGAQAITLAEMGFLVDGIDGSISAINRCLVRKINTRLPAERSNFSVGDITTLPYSDAVFDVALDVATFQHLTWEEGRQAVQETLRVLKPDGWLLSLTATPEHPQIRGQVGILRVLEEKNITKFYEGFQQINYKYTAHSDNLNQLVTWWCITARKAP